MKLGGEADKALLTPAWKIEYGTHRCDRKAAQPRTRQDEKQAMRVDSTRAKTRWSQNIIRSAMAGFNLLLKVARAILISATSAAVR